MRPPPTVFSEHKINSVEVTKQSETEGIGTIAAAQLPEKILNAQSTRIDGVAGASITSKAIISAVNKCIEQAGAKPEQLIPVTAKKGAKEEKLSTDMVVVGGGGSGMAATIEGRMRGLKVVLVEKMPQRFPEVKLLHKDQNFRNNLVRQKTVQNL